MAMGEPKGCKRASISPVPIAGTLSGPASSCQPSWHSTCFGPHSFFLPATGTGRFSFLVQVLQNTNKEKLKWKKEQ
jgi:hypothetical protein